MLTVSLPQAGTAKTEKHFARYTAYIAISYILNTQLKIYRQYEFLYKWEFHDKFGIICLFFTMKRRVC